MTAPEEHDVVFDRAGWGRWPRYTCFSEGCLSTLVRQPYMTNAQWELAKTAFLTDHPCTTIKKEER